MRAIAFGLIAVIGGVLPACGNDKHIDDPGRVTMHRLNKAEYNATVRDLLGTTLTPADDFPSDDRGFGFDNVADSLTLSPLQLELYERAAEMLVEDALAERVPSESVRTELEAVGAPSGSANGEGWLFTSNAAATLPVRVETAGNYRIAVRAGETHGGPDVARMTVRVGTSPVQTFDVAALRSSPAVYEYTQALDAGMHDVTVAFTNDYYMNGEDRNLWVDYVEVVGPLDAPAGDTTKRDRIVICDPESGEDCIRDILYKFTRRAWRRKPTHAEIDRLLELARMPIADGADAITGLELALRGVLVSPHFLFRVEVDPDPSSLVPHPVNGFELASRLSYFVWSSMPDDALLDAAEAGELETTADVMRELDRMLLDPKAAAFVDNFAGQWLFTRALGDHVPDAATYPEYDAHLEASMRAETLRYFRAFLEEDIPMDQLLLGEFTYVNDRLAQHYGLPLPNSTDLVRVSLAGTPRRGLLTQGSVLTVTSHPRRTSPVKRGKWLLDQMLCAPPPAPPPNVEGLPDDPMNGGGDKSVREQLEEHRNNEYCASCHDSIDPLGFGLEHFDGIGAFRMKEGVHDVDASGVLPGGQQFYGAGELAEILANDPRVYACMVEKLYTYALGRPPTTRDARDHIDELTGEFSQRGLVLRELVKAIVLHESFRQRRGEP